MLIARESQEAVKDVKENLKFLSLKKLTKNEIKNLIFGYKNNKWVA